MINPSIGLHDIVHGSDHVVGNFRYAPSKDGSLTNGHGSPNLDIRAKYLIGCDGANSTVRNLMKIENTDLGFENDWLVLDLVRLRPIIAGDLPIAIANRILSLATKEWLSATKG